MDLGNLYRFFSDNIDLFVGFPFIFGFVIVGMVFKDDFENLFLIEKREKSSDFIFFKKNFNSD